MRFAGAAGLAVGLRTFNGGAAGISAPCVTEDVLAQGADESLAVAGPNMHDFARRRPPMRCRRASATSVLLRRVRKLTARLCAPRRHDRGGARARTHSDAGAALTARDRTHITRAMRHRFAGRCFGSSEKENVSRAGLAAQPNHFSAAGVT